MIKTYTEDEHFDGVDFSIRGVSKGEYENCSFRNCSFSGQDLSGCIFSECEFDTCDLSLCNVGNTSFREVKFKNCKLLGLRFDHCSKLLLSLFFDSCVLNFASFYKLKLKGTVFRNCTLHEVEFIEADLSKAIFDNCDLTRATFENTVLESADFRTAYNYSMDPGINKISRARFSMPGVIRLLDKYDIGVE